MRRGFLFAGIVILLVLIGFYFIKIESDSGINFQTYDTLLGVIIFHNFFVLMLYVLIALLLIVTGISKNKK